jgi:hypothetical protein
VSEHVDTLLDRLAQMKLVHISEQATPRAMIFVSRGGYLNLGGVDA